MVLCPRFIKEKHSIFFKRIASGNKNTQECSDTLYVFGFAYKFLFQPSSSVQGVSLS